MSVESPFILIDPERCVGCHTCELVWADPCRVRDLIQIRCPLGDV